MKINPLTIRYGYHAALHHGRFRRRRFEQRLDRLPWPNGHASLERLPFTTVAMVGPSGLAELVRCLASLLRYAGQPDRFLVVVDGKIDIKMKSILENASEVVEIIGFDEAVCQDLPTAVHDRWHHPMIRKLALEMSLASLGTCLYIDSDVEFFQGAEHLASDVAALGNSPAYMQDVNATVDSRIWPPAFAAMPVNAGMLYFPKAIDWSRGISQLANLNDEPSWHTEQTVVAMAMQDANAVPLDPDRYILALDDQFEWRDRYAHKPGVVCRHYVGTIRHKMWNRWRLKP